jgi:hypothetical protein
VSGVQRGRARVVVPRLLRLSLLAHRLWRAPFEALTWRTDMPIPIPASDEPTQH